MGELIIIILVILFLLWVFVWEPQAKIVREAKEKENAKIRAEKERRQAEELARNAIEIEKLTAEKSDLLKSIRSNVPGFILDARLEFEREYRAGKSVTSFGQEMSPLVCFGYRVGKTKGRSQVERRLILKHSIAADLDLSLSFFPKEYRNEWGEPLTITRFNRIYQHLLSMADLRDNRRNFEVAVRHWREDAAWFHQENATFVNKFKYIKS